LNITTEKKGEEMTDKATKAQRCLHFLTILCVTILIVPAILEVNSPTSPINQGFCCAGELKAENPSPYHSKIDSTLSLLLTFRGKGQIPHEMKEILMKDTVSVSIKFSHKLNAYEIRLIEALGLKFKRLPKGEIAHSGTIYGAEVLWDKVDDLTELESVVRIESAWQPGVENPGNQSKHE
jgi:hypothetical protein